jgi:tetraacyldisaccharide 4'-kinase
MKALKFLLLPFSIPLWVWTFARNLLFDLGVLRVTKHEFFVVSVGNIRVGGSGKTPMVDYLIKIWGKDYCAGVLSRGYGRKSKGFFWVEEDSPEREIGEEALLIKRRNGRHIVSAVSENRNSGAGKMKIKGLDVLILDDAYQHRYIHRNVNLLLSGFQNPFFNDHLLPAGMLRETKFGAKRADALVITNSPVDLSKDHAEIFESKSKKYLDPGIPVFFSFLELGRPIPLFDNGKSMKEDCVLISGIANPKQFEESANTLFRVVKHFAFSDHQEYNQKNIGEIVSFLESGRYTLLTTEKDAIKLEAQDELSSFPVYYLPISVKFHDFGTNFDNWINSRFPG